MFNKHLFKVIAGFCAMIIVGLVSLVVIDSFKGKEQKASSATAVEEAPVSTTLPLVKKDAPAKKAPAVAKPSH